MAAITDPWRRDQALRTDLTTRSVEELRKDIERKTLELISRENVDIAELARSAEWHATLAQGHAQMEARAKEAANATEEDERCQD